MNIELRGLTEKDGVDVYEMLQEMPADENGFQNSAHGKSAEEYRDWLRKNAEMSLGIGLEDWMVPQNIYWLYVAGAPVGFGKLRHRLTKALMENGGHIGYGIRAAQRGKGYGRLILKLLLEKARGLGIGKVWVDCAAANEASRRVIEANGGVPHKRTDEDLYFWIDLK